MKKLLSLVLIILSITILFGCGEEEALTKSDGEVVGKTITAGRFYDIYHIEVVYSIGEDKFGSSRVSISGDDYDSYDVGDKVYAYYNSDGAKTISLKEK